MVSTSFARGLILLLGVIAAVIGVLIILGVIAGGTGMPALGLGLALLGIGQVLQSLDGRTS